ncbi:protein argonaute-3-like [Tropilaelaps mercedesae]|uniref:Protein argonaute-3-like n=1 Tax=Tropilaelaps mercedesae TaxID=418985 RepID=A0A1V9WYZ3_9ACAR|nr:protein argonaute-3-like [Tropilaelaps mercedesae]
MNTTAFYKPLSVPDFVREMFKDERCLHQGLTDQRRVALQKELFGLRVTHRHLQPNRTHRIERVSMRGANRETFEYEGQPVTVADYFARKYNIRLQYPNLQCIVERKGCMIPMELCTLVSGQHCRKKLSEIQTSTLIRSTATDPTARFQKVMEAVQKTRQASTAYLNEFGMSIDGTPVEVPGRVLPPPRLELERDTTGRRPEDGVWRTNRFNRPVELKKWAFVLHGVQLQVSAIIDTLMRQASVAGMQPAPPVYVQYFPPNMSEKQMLQAVKNTVDVDITVVVLGRSTSYAVLKSEAETSDLEMRTQCVKEDKLRKKFNNTFADNLLLKMNTKCGGWNWRLYPQDRPVQLQSPFMIVGADVNHPAVGDTSTPSIAAIVASVDSGPTMYYCVTSVQMRSKDKNRVEYIVDLENMFGECLDAFQRGTKTLPRIIYIYRDGVAEAQLDAVRYHEITALRAACKKIRPDYTPPMTFIVVQKRHHVRFKPKLNSEGTTRMRNIPAGTVVNSGIVHPVFSDFYLCSHQGPIGTSVPAHYHIVHDDANHKQTEIEKLSYFLCYTYARCSKSVSIPAPAYYAHLAATRAKEYIKGQLYGGDSSASLSSGDSSRLLKDFAVAQQVCQSLKGSMYFV